MKTRFATFVAAQPAFARPLLAEDEHAEALYLASLGEPLADWPFPRARLQLAYGGWLRRHRRMADSRPPLPAAVEVFDALGVTPWAERARQELRASGETSRPRTPDARDQLSPQELQIAQMAAGGSPTARSASRSISPIVRWDRNCTACFPS